MTLVRYACLYNILANLSHCCLDWTGSCSFLITNIKQCRTTICATQMQNIYFITSSSIYDLSSSEKDSYHRWAANRSCPCLLPNSNSSFYSPLLRRYAFFLSEFTYSSKYRYTSDYGVVNTLPRLPYIYIYL